MEKVLICFFTACFILFGFLIYNKAYELPNDDSVPSEAAGAATNDDSLPSPPALDGVTEELSPDEKTVSEKRVCVEVKKARVKSTLIAVESELDVRVIRKIIRQHTGAIRDCFSSLEPEVEAMIQMKWTVKKDGYVSDVSSTIIDELPENVTSCIHNEIKQWRFPRSKKKTTVEFVFMYHYVQECEWRKVAD